MIREEDVLTMARVAGLDINPAHLSGVTSALRTLVDQAALLMEPPLPAEIEPAPVYRP